MKVVFKSILFLSFVTLCVACNTKNKETNKQNLIVNVAKAATFKVDISKEFSFIAKPFRSSELSFRVGGTMERFEVYAGKAYKRGDVIAQIDARDFIIRKQRAKALYNQSKAEFERIEVLYHKKNISASAYEKAKADYISAKMAFETAANELEDTKLIATFDGYVGEVHIEKHQDVKATQSVISFVDINQLKKKHT